MRHRSSVETRWCPLLSILVLEVLQIVSACSDNSVSRVRLKLEDPKEKKVAKATLSAAPPVCPAAGLAPLQPLPYKTGHHKVTLTWHASVPPTNPNLTAVGYCLYRSKKKNVARKSATCSDCERVTPTSIARTGCVDDLVEDGATYYYVATAIAPGGSSALHQTRLLSQFHRLNKASDPWQTAPILLVVPPVRTSRPVRQGVRATDISPTLRSH